MKVRIFSFSTGPYQLLTISPATIRVIYASIPCFPNGPLRTMIRTILIRLCKPLCQTPPDKLEAAIAPILDLNEALWFLTLDCGLINSDGYWTRASDNIIYRYPIGKFHLTPCDMNEAFRTPEGPGGPGGPPGTHPDRGFPGRPDFSAQNLPARQDQGFPAPLANSELPPRPDIRPGAEGV